MFRTRKTGIIIGAALAAGFIGFGAFSAGTMMGGNDAPQATAVEHSNDPVDQAAKIEHLGQDQDGGTNAADAPSTDNGDSQGDQPVDTGNGAPADTGNEAPAGDDDQDAGDEQPADDGEGGEGGEDDGPVVVDLPENIDWCELLPDLEGCDDDPNPWLPDLDIAQAEEDKPDPPHPGPKFDIAIKK